MTLCHQVERLTSKLERTEKEVAASKSTSAEILMENKSNWTMERLQLQTRISELDDALMKATTRLAIYISTEKRVSRWRHVWRGYLMVVVCGGCQNFMCNFQGLVEGLD